MIKLRWKQTGADTRVLQHMCPFNIQVIGNGARAGELILVPAPPDAEIKWIDVPIEEVIKGDPKENFALKMPAKSSILAPANARVPKPEENAPSIVVPDGIKDEGGKKI